MDIKHFKYFVDVAKLKSFSKAAQINFVSQSTISKVVRELETELGGPLLHRNSKFVELTEAGERFYRQAAKIVDMFLNVTRHFKDEITQERYLLKIGITPITGTAVFGHLVGRFKQRYENIDIQLFEYDAKRVEEAVQDGTIDAGIICFKPQEGLYETVVFPTDTVKVVLHPSHPLAECHQIDFCDLKREKFVLLRKGYKLYDEIILRCREAGFTPDIVLETTQRDLMTQIVAANLGIALLPSKIADVLNPRLMKAVPLADPQIKLEVSLIWNAQQYVSIATQLWIDFVNEFIEQ